MSTFSTHLIHWQRAHGRHDLPWQGADAYRVWLSEIMLQQTQVATVLPYYQRFIAAFPDVATLAAAREDEVLAHWSGLGYYARGRNLHRAAQHIVAQHHGEFPREFEQLLALSGIGRSTAAAICALAYHQNRAILDGNVKRVLARYCGIHGVASDKAVEAQLWQAAESLLPQSDIAIYTQALMDMGATLCTRSKPQCARCPVRGECVANLSGQVAQLPTPRPRKIVPEKSATFLLLRYGDQILLEKRPSSGIWGGLWCPPQIEALAAWMQQQGLSGDPTPLPPFSHTFTHFKLHLTPLILEVDFLLEQPESEWMTLHAALQAAIPTPVRKILLACRTSTL
ncbi:MAG: A/G-specific adenine glycosylase [Gallionella sp.]